ncbi:hypothetical protein RoseRS_1427 [Roseiflexus sp. RS-1]|nr:hypothetical protein RoseRS_1427 [Roseiflexus sp. RS-1]
MRRRTPNAIPAASALDAIASDNPIIGPARLSWRGSVGAGVGSTASATGDPTAMLSSSAAITIQHALQRSARTWCMMCHSSCNGFERALRIPACTMRRSHLQPWIKSAGPQRMIPSASTIITIPDSSVSTTSTFLLCAQSATLIIRAHYTISIIAAG